MSAGRVNGHVVLTDLVINCLTTLIKFNTNGRTFAPNAASRANNDTATSNDVPVRPVAESKSTTLTEKCDVIVIYLEVPSLYVGVEDPANHVTCRFISRK